jgi:hypothetical protein
MYYLIYKADREFVDRDIGIQIVQTVNNEEGYLNGSISLVNFNWIIFILYKII